MNLQLGSAAIVNEAQLPKSVHEKADSGAGCAHHLGQSLLTNLGDYGFGLAFLAKMCQQQKRSCQPLLTGVKQLVNQIFFNFDIPVLLQPNTSLNLS